MHKLSVILICCQLLLLPALAALAEDYSECRVRCESENTDCSNEPAAAEPEVQAAKIAFCDQRLQTCYAECENLKPLEGSGTENNPNIIRK